MAKARIFNMINSWLDEPKQSTDEVLIIAIELGVEDDEEHIRTTQRSLLTLGAAADLRDYLNTWLDGVYTDQISRNVTLMAENTRLRTDRDAVARRIEIIERTRTNGR